MNGLAMLIGYIFIVVGGFYCLAVTGTYLMEKIMTRAKLLQIIFDYYNKPRAAATKKEATDE